VLDRFAIDYALCMYCGICVEVCPFDALFWSPEFEYATYEIDELTHEKDKLQDWTYTVLPPPELEEGAELAEQSEDESAPHSEAPMSVTPIAAPGADAEEGGG
jgi:NADH-quinone oxidoreductase subunit I